MLLSRYLYRLLLAAQPGFGLTNVLRSNQYCLRGCQLALQEVHFNDTEQDASRFAGTCQSRLSTISTYLCVHENCKPGSQINGLSELNETCHRRAQTSLPPLDIISGYTNEDIANIRRLCPEDSETEETFSEIVLPSSRLFQLAYDTLNIAYWERDLHNQYGYLMLYFWLIIIGMGIATKIFALMQRPRHQKWTLVPDREDAGNDQKTSLSGYSRWTSLWLKKYLTIPATFGYRCSQNFYWCTIPTRTQSLTIATFIALNAVLCTVNYRAFVGNLYWPHTFTQYCRYVSDRTGVISFANFPLIWLFGTRNNFLMWLTGWGFGTYTNFHRWIARVATIEAIVHSIGYTILVLEGNDGLDWASFWDYWTRRWWWAGELATMFMVAISFLSVYGLRRSHYELFLVAHIWFSVVVLVTMFWHVEIFHGRYNGPIWVCGIVWMIDRALRIIRVLSFDWKFWNTSARTTYDQDSNIVRMTISTASSFYEPRPGTYYYLYHLKDIRLWESHPFTVAYLSPSDAEPVHSTHSLTRLDSNTSLRAADNGAETTSAASSESDVLLPSSDKPSSLTFLIRPYDGFTSRLRTAALRGAVDLPILIEGPYGDTHPLHTYHNVLFVVGGTGVATPLSYLTMLLDEECPTTTVHIVWAVREHSFLSHIVQTDLEKHLHSGKLSVTAYVTQAQDDPGQTASLLQPLLTDPLWRSMDLRVHSGRPDIYEEVVAAAKDTGHGRLAVMACGPAQMADDTRRSVVGVLGFSHANIEYFEESFKW